MFFTFDHIKYTGKFLGNKLYQFGIFDDCLSKRDLDSNDLEYAIWISKYVKLQFECLNSIICLVCRSLFITYFADFLIPQMVTDSQKISNQSLFFRNMKL